MHNAIRQPHPVVVDVRHSPYGRLKPVPLSAVSLSDLFWEPRLRINRKETLFSQYENCESSGCVDNFRRAVQETPAYPFRGPYFADSDLYKWLEAASWSLAVQPDSELEALVDRAIEVTAAAQRPDGYLNTYFTFERAEERWTNFDLHEMYCAGHLFQAAVAHCRATGSEALLEVAVRFADHLCDTFGSAPEQRVAVDGHEEVKMALVELYRLTGRQRYLEQARFFLEARGRGLLGRPYERFSPEYSQDHKPLREMDTMVGHAVRAVYYTCGAADVCAETGDESLKLALERLWHNMTTRRMYISGGVGSRYEGEAFGEDYELPNARAYTESCAAIGSIMWNWRMLALEGDARYADLIETTLYNAVLPGLSLDGHHYFYQNPLADGGEHRRQAWFGCACCPPNIARMLASLPGYLYSTSREGLWIHLYSTGSVRVSPAEGEDIALAVNTNYPWDGEISVKVQSEGEFSLFLRIPGWCEGEPCLLINGEPDEGPLVPRSYHEVRRHWQAGDTVNLSLPMNARYLLSHPRVLENTGRCAVMRGPLLYCAEQVDNPGLDLEATKVVPHAPVQAGFQAELLGGVTALRLTAVQRSRSEGWTDRLYRPAPLKAPDSGEPVEIMLIPYYAWANRAPGPMRVWLSL